MAYQYPERVEKLGEYKPHEGTFEIRLDANESAFTTDLFNEKIKAILSEIDLRRYPDPMAKDLCDAAASYFGVKTENVVAGCGSDELISIITNAFGNGIGPVIVSEPDFSMYRFYSDIYDIRCIGTNKNSGKVDVDQLIKTSNEEHASIVIFSNPCNPTGYGIPKEEVIRLIESVDALVIVDEAYMDFWNQSVISEICGYENALVLKTCSKAIGFAGIRVGFALGNKKLIDGIKKVKSPYNVNTVSQQIGACVLKEKDLLEERRQTLIKGTRQLEKGLMELSSEYPEILCAYPTCTNFVYCKTDYAEKIWHGLQNYGILIRLFKDGIRVSTGTEEENVKVLQALREIIELMKK